jgi:hypothetical protein
MSRDIPAYADTLLGCGLTLPELPCRVRSRFGKQVNPLSCGLCVSVLVLCMCCCRRW